MARSTLFQLTLCGCVAWLVLACSTDESDCDPGLHVPDQLQVTVFGPDGRICDATVSAFENQGEGGQPIAETRFELTPMGTEADQDCVYEGKPAFDAAELTVLASAPGVGQTSSTTFWAKACSAPGVRAITINRE